MFEEIAREVIFEHLDIKDDKIKFKTKKGKLKLKFSSNEQMKHGLDELVASLTDYLRSCEDEYQASLKK